MMTEQGELMPIDAAKGTRRGAAYLLVLLVLVSSLAMVTSLQQLLMRRTRNLQAAQTAQQLRNALILGLQQGMMTLADDEDLGVDAPSEAWAQPAAFISNDGVALQLQLADAQRGFNLNHLSLKPGPGSPRSFLEIFEDILQNAGVEVEPADLKRLQSVIDEESVWFESLQTLQLLTPEAERYLEAADLLCAVPRPSARPLALNVNTVSPEVLHALLGSSLKGWANQILERREQEPIRSLEKFTLSLPPQLQAVLLDLLTVRSDYIEARLIAQHRNTEMRLSALLHRLPGGEVEVLRCQW
jgi:type II secretory pathway component PulK